MSSYSFSSLIYVPILLVFVVFFSFYVYARQINMGMKNCGTFRPFFTNFCSFLNWRSSSREISKICWKLDPDLIWRDCKSGAATTISHRFRFSPSNCVSFPLFFTNCKITSVRLRLMVLRFVEKKIFRCEPKFTTKLYPYWKLRKSSLIKIWAGGIMSALLESYSY